MANQHVEPDTHGGILPGGPGTGNRRSAPRSHFIVTGQARRVGAHEQFDVGVTALSRTGMQVECLTQNGAEIVPGERLLVVLQQEDEREPVALSGMIVWDGFVKGPRPWLLSAAGEDEGHWKFGVQFDAPVPDIVRRLSPRTASA